MSASIFGESSEVKSYIGNKKRNAVIFFMIIMFLQLQGRILRKEKSSVKAWCLSENGWTTPSCWCCGIHYWWNDSSLAIHTASSLPRYVIYISSFDVVAARYTKIIAWNFVNIYLKGGGGSRIWTNRKWCCRKWVFWTRRLILSFVVLFVTYR